MLNILNCCLVVSDIGLKQVLSGNLFEQNLFDIRSPNRFFSCHHLDSLSICECKDGQRSLRHGATYREKNFPWNIISKNWSMKS